MASSLPRHDIPETEKTQEWCNRFLDYSISILNDKDTTSRLSKMQRMRNSYNGILDKRRILYLTKTYGKTIKGQFIDFRLGKPKIDLLVGEWLKRKLNSEVRSENREAKAKKLDKLYTAIGMREAQPQLDKIKQEMGFDAFSGMDIPTKKEGVSGSNINVKTKNEIFMSHVLKDHINRKGLKGMLSKNFFDVVNVAECHGRVYIKSNRTVHYEIIRPEDAIYIEGYDDDHLKTSPIRGHRKWMFIHDIMNEYELSKDDRDKLDQMKGQASTMTNKSYHNRKMYRMMGEELGVEVIRIEFTSSRPVYTKMFPNGRQVDISPESYEKNKSKIRLDEKNGKFKLRKLYKVELWEAHKIGHDIYSKCERLKYQMRSVDGPHDPQGTYVSLLFNTVDGVRISLQETIGDISFLYNVVMWQINRELAKSKGKVIAYDEAYLPRGFGIKDVMHNLVDDAIYLYNSSQDGNKIGRDVQISGQIKEIDLGLSDSFSQLIATKLDLQAMVDRISGISENREGQIAASSTVTNAQSNIVASRTISEPMFFFMERFTEEVMTKIVESYKVTIGVMGSEELDLILGDEGVAFFKGTRDVSNDDYGARILDGRQEAIIREALDKMSEVSVNAKELRVQDWLGVQLSDTLAEAQEVLKKGWKDVKEARIQADQIRSQSNTEKLKSQREGAIEDREDTQEHETNLALISAGAKGLQENQKGLNKLLVDQSAVEQAAGPPQLNQ